MRMLGDACGECSLQVGSDCIPCPEGSDFPECVGCVAGARPHSTWVTDIAIPIAVGVATTLAVTFIANKLLK
jgi:hypothetical protein